MLTSAEHLLHMNMLLLLLLFVLMFKSSIGLRWALFREDMEDEDDEELASASPRFEDDEGRGECEDVVDDVEHEGEAGDMADGSSMWLMFDGPTPPPTAELRRVEVAVIPDVLKDICE